MSRGGPALFFVLTLDSLGLIRRYEAEFRGARML